MENNTFSYSYSAQRNKEVEEIRKKYLPKEESKIEKLKRLDLRVKSAGTLESLCLGTLGALVFGMGMCFFLDVFTGGAFISAILMIAGTLMMIPAYPICVRISRRTRRELTPEILRLSEEIIKSQSN